MSKHHSTTRVLAALLSALMTLSATELPVWAGDWQENEAEEEIGSLPAVIHTPNGDVEIEEDWNEVYPYGTFAFGTYQADVAEPGALTADGEEIPQTVLIPVYRLGGTVGRVTAKIQYSPAVTMDPDGVETIYDYAASGKNDLLIEYEAPTAAAAFQPVGLPESVRRMLPAEDAAVTFDAEGLNAETLTEDDELSLFLAGDPHADAYTWQARVGGGDWQDIDGGADPTLLVTWGEIWDFENSPGTPSISAAYTVWTDSFTARNLFSGSVMSLLIPRKGRPMIHYRISPKQTAGRASLPSSNLRRNSTRMNSC